MISQESGRLLRRHRLAAGLSQEVLDDKQFDDVYNDLASGQQTEATNAVNARGGEHHQTDPQRVGRSTESVCK